MDEQNTNLVKGQQITYTGNPFQVPLSGGYQDHSGVCIVVSSGAVGRMAHTDNHRNVVIVDIELGRGIAYRVSVPREDVQPMPITTTVQR